MRDTETHNVWKTNRLPNPQQQADYFIDYLGQSGHAPDQWIDCPPIEIAGIVGTADEPQVNRTSSLTYIINNLLQERMIEPHSNHRSFKVKYRLTFLGWARFQELRKLGIESNIAFMAMGYGNPSVDRAFSEFLQRSCVPKQVASEGQSRHLIGGKLQCHPRILLRSSGSDFLEWLTIALRYRYPSGTRSAGARFRRALPASFATI